MTLQDLLELTLIQQRQVFDIDVQELEGEEFAAYVRDNVLAATVELGEFIQELPWKPWKDGQGRPAGLSREAAVYELVDVLKFWLNLVTALRISSDELEHAFGAKHEINAQRQAARAELVCPCGVGGGGCRCA